MTVEGEAVSCVDIVRVERTRPIVAKNWLCLVSFLDWLMISHALAVKERGKAVLESCYTIPIPLIFNALSCSCSFFSD